MRLERVRKSGRERQPCVTWAATKLIQCDKGTLVGCKGEERRAWKGSRRGRDGYGGRDDGWERNEGEQEVVVVARKL